jgi:hypothetical protein
MAFHAGFDILQYPATAMDWLKGHTNLVWCGYYLAPAPNRPSSTWMGALGTIKDQWGVLPIYVGQQDERTAHGDYVPSSILTKDQGGIDGKAACDLVASEGFAAGSYVYLDWEYGGLDGDGSTDYIAAWVSAVVDDGRAKAGIYCSHVIAQAIANLIDAMNPTPNARFFCWKVTNASSHPFTGDLSNLPELNPAGCGFAGAQSWQREQQAVVAFPDDAPVSSLMMDFSTSSLSDPGAPGAILDQAARAVAAERSLPSRAARKRRAITAASKRTRPAVKPGAKKSKNGGERKKREPSSRSEKKTRGAKNTKSKQHEE